MARGGRTLKVRHLDPSRELLRAEANLRRGGEACWVIVDVGKVLGTAARLQCTAAGFWLSCGPESFGAKCVRKIHQRSSKMPQKGRKRCLWTTA